MSRSNRTLPVAICGAMLFGAASVAAWQTDHEQTVRGAEVAGVALGGLSRADAERRLTAALPTITRGRITLATTEGSATFTADQLGLSVDVPGTVARAVELRTPLRDAVGALTEQTVGAVVHVDRARFDAAVGRATALVHAAREGAVVFRGGKPVPIEPAAGDRIPLDRAATTVADNWPAAKKVTVPTEAIRPTVSAEAVHAVAAGAAARAVAADVVLTLGGAPVGTASPADIGTFLSFRPDGAGTLAPQVDRVAARRVLAPRLAGAERRAKDAAFRLGGGAPSVTPSEKGREVVWEPTVDAIATAASADGAGRRAAAVFRPTEPKITTEKARTLGIREVVSEFTTGGFADASGVNIRRVAQQVDGALVLPGETFSLNGFTGPRGIAQGYVESGIINNGRPDKAVGGGISQFATTLYNAAYFAGLEDAGHTEHSYYISRYPEAREATVFEGAIDLKFRNDTPYGIVIETAATASDVTVRMWSTKIREVTSATGERTAPTEPTTVRLPKGPHCVASTGQPGFTTSNTRTIAEKGATRTHTRTVKYDPVPTVICE